MSAPAGDILSYVMLLLSPGSVASFALLVSTTYKMLLGCHEGYANMTQSKEQRLVNVRKVMHRCAAVVPTSHRNKA